MKSQKFSRQKEQLMKYQRQSRDSQKELPFSHGKSLSAESLYQPWHLLFLAKSLVFMNSKQLSRKEEQFMKYQRQDGNPQKKLPLSKG